MTKPQKKSRNPKSQPSPTVATSVRPAWVTWMNQWEKFLDAHVMEVSVVLLLFSALLRYGYFQEARRSPASTLHQWRSSDMEFYHATAKRLAAGDWLLDTAMQPYHDWHDDVARLMLERHPDKAAGYYARFPKPDSLGGGIDTLAARKAYMSDMLGGKTFYQDPLYAYLIAFTYWLLGPDPQWVYLWQMLLGALMNVLVFWLGRMLFGSLAGVLGAVLVMLSGPIMVYEMTLLRSTLTAFLTVLSLYAYLRVLRRPRSLNGAGLGVVAGLSTLNQSYFLLFWLPALLWLGWNWRHLGRQAWKLVAAVVTAWLLTLSPLFYRNARVGAPIAAFSGAGPIIYVSYNGPISYPLEPNFWNAQSTVDLYEKSNGSLLRAVPVCWSAFETNRERLRVYREKLEGLFVWMEIPNNVSYYMYRQFSPTLKALPAPYYWVAPLGLVGLVLGFWRLRRVFVPYFFMLAISALPLFLSTSVARYRTPFVVLITLLAAYTVVVILRSLLERRFKTAASALLLMVGAAAFTWNIRERQFFPYYPSDIVSVYLAHYSKPLLQLELDKKYDEYTQLLGEFLNYLPEHFFRLNIHSRLRQNNEASCCQYVARFLDMQGTILSDAGRPEEGRKYTERAAILRALADDFFKRLEMSKKMQSQTAQ